MIGKRRPQRELFDVGNVYALALPPESFHAQLAAAAPRLFRDEEFAAFYSEGMGRPSVPPSQLALMTLLQHEAGCSDAEAVARTAYDLRWAAVLGRAAGEPLCAKSTFQLFRAHLVLHEAARLLFEGSIQAARRTGLLKGSALRLAIDTKPILGRGAVEDTYNLLSTGIQQLVRALASREGERGPEGAARHDLRRYFGPSLKGSTNIDWSDEAARNEFLTGIVVEARRLLRLAAPAVAEGNEAVREAAWLLEPLLLQDVAESAASGGRPTASLKEGHEPGRMPSATDPEVRHGRKSASKRFDGHKASVAVDTQSGIIVDAELLAGDAPDATRVLEQVERVEASTGTAVALTLGDCAYGSGDLRQQFADAERVLVAKVPQRTNAGMFPKSAFLLDLEGHTIACPGGETTGRFTTCRDGTQVFHFGTVCRGCSLRGQCTTAQAGREVRVHPQEALLQAAREYQQSAEGQAVLRERVVAENRLGRLGQLGIGQARYLGRRKTRCQLLLAAAVANRRRTWNWLAAEHAQATAGAPSEPASQSTAAHATTTRAGRGPVSGWIGSALCLCSHWLHQGWLRRATLHRIRYPAGAPLVNACETPFRPQF